MSDPLELPATLDRLDHLRASGVLDPLAHRAAAHHVVSSPSLAAWARQLDIAALASGSVLIVSGILYLVAFRWSEVGPTAQVVLATLPMLVAGGVAAWSGTDRLGGQIALTAAGALLLAPLLAIATLHTSTGEPWPLAAVWAVGLLPFTLAARSPFAWLLQIAAGQALLAVGAEPFFGPWGDQAVRAALVAHVGYYTVALAVVAALRALRLRAAPPWLPDLAAIGPLAVLTSWSLYAIAESAVKLAPLDVAAVGALGLALLAAHVAFFVGRVRLLPAAAASLSALTVALAVSTRASWGLADAVDDGGLLLILLPLNAAFALAGILAVAIWLHLGWRRGASRGAR
jgi:hypothetical protein